MNIKTYNKNGATATPRKIITGPNLPSCVPNILSIGVSMFIRSFLLTSSIATY